MNKIINAIKIAFGRNDYWHPAMPVNINASEKKISQYYVDMSEKVDYPGKFDANGIPLVLINNQLKYFPVTIAQYALGCYDLYVDTQQKKYFTICQRCADWFVYNSSKNVHGVYGFIHDFPKDLYGLNPGWISGMAQGQAMSVLARCYVHKKKRKYIEVCNQILDSFEKKIEEGGVLSLIKNRYYYQEYPSEIGSFVLNGFIFSLWGLLDFYLVSKNKKAKKLYDYGVETLIYCLPKFNIGCINWSRYDLYPFRVTNISSKFYHMLHIEQIRVMYSLTGIAIFEEYVKKWNKSKKNVLISFLATVYKIIHKLSVIMKMK